MDAAVGFGPQVWSPAWIVLVMLVALVVLVVGGLALAVLLGLWSGRSGARDERQKAPDQQ
ncbi:hypothetical protein ACWEOW_09390 [Monashia sp. NPDC004114]